MAPIYSIETSPEKADALRELGFDIKESGLPRIVKSDYVQIPDKDFVIAIEETDKGFSYEGANRQVLKNRAEVPQAREFMQFHNHVIDCYKNKETIFDAAGNPVSSKVKKDLFRQLTQDCWTWLNGQFHFSDEGNTIEYVGGLDSQGNLLKRTEALKPCLMEDCFIDFTRLTKQGFANLYSKVSNQKFVRGENIYFYAPIDGAVAGFNANSDWAFLSCFRSPSGGDSSLGVRRLVRIGNIARKD